MYAFCNTHDITWGTRAEEEAPKLDAAKVKPDGKVDLNIPQDDGDLNAQYEAEMKKIEQKEKEEKPPVKESEKQEDYYKGFRSAVVLAWMFCNFILTATVLSTAGLDRVNLRSNETQRATIYMAVVLWSVAGLSMFRFGGAVWFLVVRFVSFFPSMQISILAPRIFFFSFWFFLDLLMRRLLFSSSAGFEQVWKNLDLEIHIFGVGIMKKFDVHTPGSMGV